MNKKITLLEGSIFYVLLALLINGLFLINHFIDNQYLDLIFGALALLISVLVLFFLDRTHHLHLSIRTFWTVKILYFLVPFIITLIATFGKIKSNIDIFDVILLLIKVIVTAFWEEYFYRGVGIVLLKDKTGKLSGISLAIMIFTFILLEGINAIIFQSSFINFLYNSIHISVFGMFLLMFYLNTHNALFPLISHILIEFCSEFFEKFIQTPYVGETVSKIMSLFCLIIYLISSIYFYSKYQRDNNDGIIVIK